MWVREFSKHYASFTLEHLTKRTLRNLSIIHPATINRHVGVFEVAMMGLYKSCYIFGPKVAFLGLTWWTRTNAASHHWRAR